MGRKLLAAFLAALTQLAFGTSNAVAQNLCTTAPASAQLLRCTDVGFFERSKYVDKIMGQILQVTKDMPVSLPPITVCKLPGLNNAMSIACPSQERPDFRIFYDPVLMAELDVRSNNRFVTLGFFAHEVGHFVELLELKELTAAERRFGMNMPWQAELRADRHAGYVLAKMGATYADVQSWQRLMFAGPSFTHPDALRRIQEMLKGYVDGGGSVVSGVDVMAIATEISIEMSRW